MRPAVSASQFERARHCTWSWNCDIPWEDKPGYSARLGTLIHLGAERLLKGEEMGHVVETVQWETAAMKKNGSAALWQFGEVRERHADERWDSEVKLASDGKTSARFLVSDKARDYGERTKDEWLTGTVDIIRRAPDGMVIGLDDIKTGFSQVIAKESWQLRVLGWMLAKKDNLTSIPVRIITVRPQHEYVDPHVLGELELAEAGAEIARVKRMLYSGAPAVAGEHCRYCPVAYGCDTLRKYERKNA
jgi:PD-(D/E)XK nuclease superfamily